MAEKTGSKYPWFVWPAGIWAFFIIAHAIGTIHTLGKIDGKLSAVQKEADRLSGKWPRTLKRRWYAWTQTLIITNIFTLAACIPLSKQIHAHCYKERRCLL